MAHGGIIERASITQIDPHGSFGVEVVDENIDDGIRCACLGTALNLPMTTITLVEDLGMAAMAAVMLFTH